MMTICFRRGRKRAEKEWQQFIPQKMDIGTTKSLEILPFIDWYTEREDLKGEAGVSYSIKTDEKSILFDVGLNMKRQDPSPLLHNMKQLGIGIADFDTIVISHNHSDHVGGIRWQLRRSFSLTNHQIDLGEKTVYTPVPMTYPGLAPIYTEKPTVIAKGVATIGTIANELFPLGWTPEQALAINVEGKGIVLVVGCGHQTLPKILQRTEALFDEPVYGIIGGLHYPVTDSRVKVLGIKLQRIVATGKSPLRPITMDEVKENINYLKERSPKVVGLSAHDSCDFSLAAFRDAFGDSYKEVKVGRKIII